MTATDATVDPVEANRQALVAELARLRALLEGSEVPAPEAESPALATIAAGFGLSAFERDVLLLAAAVELESEFPSIWTDDDGWQQPTFGLALALIPGAHWSALSPEAPLRRWRLVEIDVGLPVTRAPLRIAERVLHYLAGIPAVEELLRGLVSELPAEPLPLSWAERTNRVAAALASGNLVELRGTDSEDARCIVAGACVDLGTSAFALDASDVPEPAAERDTLARIWEREAVLTGAVLTIECIDLDADRARPARLLAEVIAAPCVLAVRESLGLRRPSSVPIEVPALAAGERRGLWQDVLGEPVDDRVVDQFGLGLGGIRAVGAAVDAGEGLWDACRAEARPRLDDLAQRIEPAASWDDLVLPQRERQILHDITVHVRQRATVYDRWGWRTKGSRGLGVAVLFSGPSGTGKTMGAEVLAAELALDLYRIDLSGVVSKYIGETEKNLRRVFDAAEAGGAILLFDEADALFGKRSEVKDSHDRYANIEVSYLLQRMEAYRGLAILTTNMRGALDPAFLRRLRFVVTFPFPDQAQRAEIWRGVFPIGTPTEGLEPERLARLNVAGGTIRNIALGGAFLAAGAGEPVRMEHLLRAARSECAKLEKPLSDAELGGWA